MSCYAQWFTKILFVVLRYANTVATANVNSFGPYTHNDRQSISTTAVSNIAIFNMNFSVDNELAITDLTSFSRVLC